MRTLRLLALMLLEGFHLWVADGARPTRQGEARNRSSWASPTADQGRS